MVPVAAEKHVFAIMTRLTKIVTNVKDTQYVNIPKNKTENCVRWADKVPSKM